MPNETNPSAAGALRVMLVDDNVDAVESMQILLEAFGYEVATAVHPDLALELVDRFDPSIAVVDIGLPGMDGYQLATEIRRRRDAAGRAAPRLVALTGYGGPEDAARATAAGFATHLVKPVEIEQLLAVLAA
jgi:CheY-like chemotaxis protein